MVKETGLNGIRLFPGSRLGTQCTAGSACFEKQSRLEQSERSSGSVPWRLR